MSHHAQQEPSQGDSIDERDLTDYLPQAPASHRRSSQSRQSYGSRPDNYQPSNFSSSRHESRRYPQPSPRGQATPRFSTVSQSPLPTRYEDPYVYSPQSPYAYSTSSASASAPGDYLPSLRYQDPYVVPGEPEYSPWQDPQGSGKMFDQAEKGDMGDGEAGGDVKWEDSEGRPIGVHGAGAGHHSGGVRKVSEEKTTLRMKKLEQAFGSPPIPANDSGEDEDVDSKRNLRIVAPRRSLVGLLDKRGNLVVGGRKRRLAARWMQGLGALAVAGCLIGAAILIKPAKTPPPASTPPLYALYVLSFVSLLSTIYRGLSSYCCASKHSQNSASMSQHGQMMMLPVISGGRGHAYGRVDNQGEIGWCCCGGGRKGKRHGNGQQQPLSVNLIMDPALFAPQQAARPRTSLSSNKPTEDDDASDTDSLDIPRSARAPGGKESMNPLQRIGYEARVEEARKSVKRGIVWDFIAGTLWLAWCIWQVGFGKKCSPGGTTGGAMPSIRR